MEKETCVNPNSFQSFCLSIEAPSNKSNYKSFFEWDVEIICVSAEEVAQRRCSIKKVLLKVLKNSQRNTCAGIFLLIKLKVTDWLYRKESSIWYVS